MEGTLGVKLSGGLDGRFESRETAVGTILVPKAEPRWAAPVAADGGATDSKGSEDEPAGGAGHDDKKRTKGGRRLDSHGPRIETGGKLGGPFERAKEPLFVKRRLEKFQALMTKQQEELAARPPAAITVTLPDGKQVTGEAWKTTPMNVAEGIAKSLAKSAIVARVKYTRRLAEGPVLAKADDEEEEVEVATAGDDGELWDMTRPLEGDCNLLFRTFKDEEGKTVFWHSSAHVLGQCMEQAFGVHLTIGPPTEEGFYYDSYMGKDAVAPDTDYDQINAVAKHIIKEQQSFERLVLSKDEALELFADNPFKVQLITNKVPEGAMTSAYRCGPLIDLCMGPHIPSTGLIKAFEVVKHSASYWLANADNDSLQRVYGVSFPDTKQMKLYKKRVEEAKKRDHRLIGVKQQDLFFFHDLSPGSCFFLPPGARMYNRLIDFIKIEYRKRGYTEVVSPNVYNLDLWKISGHADHYLENMFTFDCEKTTFGLKPMNCPGHCLMFAHRLRSHRDLPLRLADFGVLHRNEFSGALTGLTRVRRFQQDDAHIFCREDQIKQEVAGVLDFMHYAYRVFGFDFELMLSTRPKKALGDKALWDRAEAMMSEALDDFCASIRPSAAAAGGDAGEAAKGWRLNPGDGAFYGPKIDIQVFDALGRRHQCATIQLDFQLPIRFNLSYKGEAGPERPVMVHRAILGSVERMMAILTEHYAGKWPLWLSPRQVMIVPVAATFNEYAQSVRQRLHDLGFDCEAETSTKTLNKKIRESQIAQWNYILVVGAEEQEHGTVNVRTREKNEVLGEKKVDEFERLLQEQVARHE